MILRLRSNVNMRNKVTKRIRFLSIQRVSCDRWTKIRLGLWPSPGEWIHLILAVKKQKIIKKLKNTKLSKNSQIIRKLAVFTILIPEWARNLV